MGRVDSCPAGSDLTLSGSVKARTLKLCSRRIPVIASKQKGLLGPEALGSTERRESPGDWGARSLAGSSAAGPPLGQET